MSQRLRYGMYKSSEKLSFRLIAEELKELKAEASHAGINLSELIREKVLGEVASQPHSQSPPPPQPTPNLRGGRHDC